MNKFKIGDRVKGTSPYRIKGQIGTIIYIPSNDYYSIEFDNNINGHEHFNNPKEFQCKKGHGWNCVGYEIELIKSIQEPIYNCISDLILH